MEGAGYGAWKRERRVSWGVAMAIRFSTREYASLFGETAPGYKKPSKYGNKKAELDGIVFDSEHEKEVYAELKIKEKAGEITDLKIQPAFELIPAIRKPDGTLQRAVLYKADFSYMKGEKLHVIDAKGYRTKVFLLKKKLLYYTHKIDVIEVKPGESTP